MLGPSVVTLTVELLDSRRQLLFRRPGLGKITTSRVPLTGNDLKALVRRLELRYALGQSRGLGNLTTSRIPLALGRFELPLERRPRSARHLHGRLRLPQLLLGLRGAPALLLERPRTLLGPRHEPLALPLELPHTLLLPLRGGLGRFDSGGLIGSLPRHLAGPPLVLTCRRLGSLDGALVPALEVGELRPQFAHRVFGHLPRLPVGLSRPLELGRRTLTLARRCLGLREPRALVGALPLELLEPPGGDGGRSFGGLACARRLVASIPQSLLELGRGRVRSLERAASRVALRRDLLQPTRSLRCLTPRGSEQPLELRSGLGLGEPTLERAELRFELGDPRFADRDVGLRGSEPAGASPAATGGRRVECRRSISARRPVPKPSSVLSSMPYCSARAFVSAGPETWPRSMRIWPRRLPVICCAARASSSSSAVSSPFSTRSAPSGRHGTCAAVTDGISAGRLPGLSPFAAPGARL